MSYTLFLDDLRQPPEIDWIVCRSSDAAIKTLKEKGMPARIAFDHDLGDKDTAMRFLAWLEEQCIEGKFRFPKEFTFTIHSFNVVGVENIWWRMRGLLNHFSES